ncbi:MAG: hypothetical protein AB8E74_06890 [Prochlorococcus sp.]
MARAVLLPLIASPLMSCALGQTEPTDVNSLITIAPFTLGLETLSNFSFSAFCSPTVPPSAIRYVTWFSRWGLLSLKSPFWDVFVSLIFLAPSLAEDCQSDTLAPLTDVPIRETLPEKFAD